MSRGHRFRIARGERPAYHPVEAIEHGPAGALDGKAFRAHTIQEHAAIGRIESKEVRGARCVFVSKILLLERVSIPSKELPGVFFIVQMKARNEDQALRQLLFI